MSIATYLAEIAENRTRRTRPLLSGRQVDPAMLVQNVLAEVDAKALSWPNGKDFPHQITVFLSKADFSCFGANKRTAERHIEDAVAAHAQQHDALLERSPHVCIMIDPYLPGARMRVEASFGSALCEEAGRKIAAAMGPRNPRAGGPIPFDAKTVALGCHEGQRVENGPMPAAQAKGQGGASTPACAPPDDKHPEPTRTATLTSPSFSTRVHPGDTIGRVRYETGRPEPTVKLEGPDFEFVSHSQGSFSHDGTSWSFTSTGRNGTSVQRNGAWIKLPDHERFPLEDGDCISFGKSAPLTFAIAS